MFVDGLYDKPPSVNNSSGDGVGLSLSTKVG
jgi:hypothetical protein